MHLLHKTSGISLWRQTVKSSLLELSIVHPSTVVSPSVYSSSLMALSTNCSSNSDKHSILGKERLSVHLYETFWDSVKHYSLCFAHVISSASCHLHRWDIFHNTCSIFVQCNRNGKIPSIINPECMCLKHCTEYQGYWYEQCAADCCLDHEEKDIVTGWENVALYI